MERLSIGVLIDVVYPFTLGGAEKRFSLLTEELASRGHDVTVYAMKWWDGPREHVEHGVRYVAVAEPSALYADGARRTLAQPARFALSALRGMRGARHDLVDCNQFPFVHLPGAHAAAWMRRQRLVVTWHEVWRDYWFEYAPFPAGVVGAAIEDVAPHLAAANIAVSRHTARRLLDMGVRRERVLVVPNAIDLARVDAVAPRDEPTDIVFVGRLIAHKRVDRLIAAVARLRRRVPGVRCTIVGSGPEERRLRALARGLGVGDHVEFTGPLQDEADLVAVMKSARLFVSASEREGFGIAALEAMAARLPVVTIAAPMNALAGDLVEHGRNGLVLPPTSRALADGIASLLEDEGRRRPMAARARACAEAYDRRRVGAQLELAYLHALERPAPAHLPNPLLAPLPAEAR